MTDLSSTQLPPRGTPKEAAPSTPRYQSLAMVKRLSLIEPAALSMLKPIDVATIDPVVVEARGKNIKLWHYWRVALSSETQNSMSITQGRYQLYFVMDKTSGGLLGIFALGDAPECYPYLERQFDWEERRDKKNGRPYNAAKWSKYHTILYMHRCLPVYEFGNLIGGKLLTLMATSRELIRGLELRYSFLYTLFLVRTLHGKSSQYNRLHQRGLVEVGTDELGRGMLWMELRKNALKYLKEEVPTPSKPATFTMKEQVDYWKTRWFLPRAERLGVTRIVPDIDNYRVSNLSSVTTETDGECNEYEDREEEAC